MYCRGMGGFFDEVGRVPLAKDYHELFVKDGCRLIIEDLAGLLIEKEVSHLRRKL